jgi:hypothetical protein
MGGLAPCGLKAAALCARGLRVMLSCVTLGGLALGVAGEILAYGPIGLDKDLKSYPLQASEMSRLDIRSGWIDGAPERMVFEIRNPLSAPVQCSAVSVELKDRSKAVRPLEPAIWIPVSQTRRSGARPLRKDDVKQFSLVCSCLRKTERSACEAPLRD